MTETLATDQRRYSLNEIVYILLFLLIAAIPYSKYFVSGSIPLPSPDPHFFYAFFSFHHGAFHEGHIPQWNPYYGMGIDTSSLDPTYNPYRLPNFIGYLFSEPMQGWVFMLIAQVFLMGFCSFKYFKYLGIKPQIAFMCGVIYMLTPLHDEFIYQSFWGYIYIFTPILLVVLHKYRDGRINTLNEILWIAVILSATYLSAGAIGPIYLIVGSFIYIVFILIPRENSIKHFVNYLRLFIVSGILALGLSAYILYPFIVESRFMVRPRFIYDFGSFFVYIKYVILQATTFFVPIFAGIYLDSMDVLSSTVIEVCNYTWFYINIALIPAVIYVYQVKREHRRFVYFIFFLFFFVLNTIPFLNLDVFFSGVIKGYGVRKLFMFYSLSGCVIIGFFFQKLTEQENGLGKGVQGFLKGLFYFYAFLILGLTIVLLYFWLIGVSIADVYVILRKFADITNINILKLILFKINARVEKVGFYYRCFIDAMPLYYVYYLSIFGMLFVLVKRNKYCFKKCRHWVFTLLIVINVNILYFLVFPMMDSGIVKKISTPPNNDDWIEYVEDGDRVAIYMNYKNTLPNKFNNELPWKFSDEVDNTVMERFSRMRNMTFNEIAEQAKMGGLGTANSAAENLIYLNPFMHNKIRLFTSKLHYVYPGGVEYYNRMNGASEFFQNHVKNFSRVYQYPYLYDGFDKSLVDRLGIRIVFANLPFKSQGMDFISKTEDGLYIYKNNDTHPLIKLTYSDENRSNEPVNYHIEDSSDFKNNKKRIMQISINTEGEKQLATTIPYNKHWILTGDGNPLKITKDNDIFIGTTVPANVKNIEFIYDNTSKKVGIGISIVFLLFWLIIYFKPKNIKLLRNEN